MPVAQPDLEAMDNARLPLESETLLPGYGMPCLLRRIQMEELDERVAETRLRVCYETLVGSSVP